MKISRQGSTTVIDLHGMRQEDALFRLEHYISHAPSDIKEILVIHGFNRGQVLRDAVRSIKHPRIKTILKTLTDGQTRLILK